MPKDVIAEAENRDQAIKWDCRIEKIAIPPKRVQISPLPLFNSLSSQEKAMFAGF